MIHKIHSITKHSTDNAIPSFLKKFLILMISEFLTWNAVASIYELKVALDVNSDQIQPKGLL